MRRLTLALVAANLLWGSALAGQDVKKLDGSKLVGNQVSIYDGRDVRPVAQCVEKHTHLLCSSRKPITPAMVEVVKQVEGVEDVISARRYSFMVLLGELFEPRDVGTAILKVLR
jgi:hypothetical protein